MQKVLALRRDWIESLENFLNDYDSLTVKTFILIKF